MKHIKFLLLISMLVIVSACETSSTNNASDKKQQLQQEELLNEANNQLGLPAIHNFTEKKTLKMIYELCDQENLICYAYLFNRNSGTIGQFLGKCIGYGIPYSTQYSNPEKFFGDPNGSFDAGSLVMPQAEPNGLFKPTGLSATWLLLIDPVTNEPRPVYIEPEIIVSPFKLD